MYRSICMYKWIMSVYTYTRLTYRDFLCTWRLTYICVHIWHTEVLNVYTHFKYGGFYVYASGQYSILLHYMISQIPIGSLYMYIFTYIRIPIYTYVTYVYTFMRKYIIWITSYVIILFAYICTYRCQHAVPSWDHSNNIWMSHRPQLRGQHCWIRVGKRCFLYIYMHIYTYISSKYTIHRLTLLNLSW